MTDKKTLATPENCAWVCIECGKCQPKGVDLPDDGLCFFCRDRINGGHIASPDCFCRPYQDTSGVWVHREIPLTPSHAMVMAGASRLAHVDNGCDFPDAWSPLELASMKNMAERVWRSMVLEFVEETNNNDAESGHD